MSITSKWVLIIDCNEASRTALKRSFETLKPDYQVITAPDGFRALGRLLQHPIDLALAGDQGPGMDRPELVEAIHEISPETRILLIADDDPLEIANAAKPVEFDGCIRESFTSAQIVDMIEQVITT
jgi:DNA-binding NarL/FixJ family response regulator